MKVSLFVLATFLILLSGCESMPTKEKMNVADYGTEPDAGNAAETAKSIILDGLFDPYSAVINCGVPVKGVVNKGFENRYGYILKCKVNAKNRLGGFTGVEPSFFWIRDDHIKVIEPPFKFVAAEN